jgi:hypothetical protein
MSLLTETFNDYFTFKNKKYKVDMTYDNILRLFEMFNDGLISKVEKPIIAVKMLVDNLELNSYEQYIDLFKFLMQEFLSVDVDSANKDEQPKFYDWDKDADIIYASFYAEYKIDLIDMQGVLHWKKFIALLNYLDDESKFKQVVGIRSMKVPSTQEASQDYIDHIRKMKELYSLEDTTNEQNINSVFDNLALAFKSNLKEVGDNGG